MQLADGANPALAVLTFCSCPSGQSSRENFKSPLTTSSPARINIQVSAYLHLAMNSGKTFRHGQILRLISDPSISNQEELRRRLAAQKLRVTQATLSRDLQELRLVKTHEGYRAATALPEESNGLPSLARALGEFLSDIRPAENLLVLKTPPGGAQALAAAVDTAKFPETAGTIPGDDTILTITPDKQSHQSLQKKIESLLS